jgi:glucose-6-phosphate 1-epimerase
LNTNSIAHGDLKKLVIDHPAASAEVFPYGAHLTQWTPAGGTPMIFLSPNSAFTPGKPIRGGVPVCFPWFGANPADANLPMHGFARISEWTVADITETADAAVARFELRSSDATHKLWPHDFVAEMTYSLGRELEMKLAVRNTGTSPLEFEAALHTYFAVSDIRNVSVAGLQGTQYLDKVDDMRRKTDSDPAVRFVDQVDRTYLNTEATCTIDDPGIGRKIVVAKTGSRTTVVWNPALKRATELTDIGPAAWPGFVCVETANVGENKITLAAGKTHEMTARVTVS